MWSCKSAEDGLGATDQTRTAKSMIYRPMFHIGCHRAFLDSTRPALMGHPFPFPLPFLGESSHVLKLSLRVLVLLLGPRLHSAFESWVACASRREVRFGRNHVAWAFHRGRLPGIP